MTRSQKFLLIPFLSLLGLVLIFGVLFRIWLGSLSALVPYIFDMAGFNGERTYLVLFQNNNELRPGGGFISAYGVVKVKNGSATLSFSDSYKLQNEENLRSAPDPINVLFNDGNEGTKVEEWHFRDGNFDVSFPRAAMDLERLYWEQSGLEKGSFDGIFAFNFEFLEDLVEIYKLEAGVVELNRENLFAQLEFETKNIDTHNLEELVNRKNILGQIMFQLSGRMMKSFWKYDDFFAALNAALEQKKIMLYFKDEELQKLVVSKGWAGNFEAKNFKNFIHTNFANLGGRKSDRYLRKTHKYFLSFDENNRGRVRYTVSLEHLGNYNLNSDIYKAYLRIFIPMDSEFLSTEGKFYNDMGGYTGAGYFEAYLKMEPGEKKDISIEYLLPEKISMEDFELDIVKQSGSKDLWQVLVRLPGDNSFEADAGSGGFEVRENVGYFVDYLLSDSHFDFEYVRDSLPPLVIWQRFIKTNLIEINFSEIMDETAALDRESYEILDLDYEGGETDAISVENAYMDGNKIYLETEGISRNEEERYSLILKNLEDLYGNKTRPEVLELTLVQRL